jgi:uncharacterized protein YycO
MSIIYAYKFAYYLNLKKMKMKKTMTVVLLLCATMLVNQSKAQSYFAAELTTKGVYAYVQMPEGTTGITGSSLKGKAVAITATQFKAIKAGEIVKAIKINGVNHVPNPEARNGGYEWCSYETLSGGTAWYQCKTPPGGGSCCTMVIVLTPTTSPK